MVRRGAFSKGCPTCRKRKIKCDQLRPNCTQCLKAGWACPRYGDSADRMFQHHCVEGLRISTHQSHTRCKKPSIHLALPADSPPVVLPRRVAQPITDVAIDFFLTNYIFRDSGSVLRGFYEYLFDYRNDPRPDKTLSTTLGAVALGAYACSFHDPDALSRATRLFGSALKLVNTALMSPQEVVKDSTLISVLLFATFGTVTSTSAQSLIDCHTHMRGAMTIMRLRGRSPLDSRNGLLLFLHTSVVIVQSCIYNSVRVPEDLISLRDYAEKSLDAKDPAWKLSKIVITLLPAFHADVKEGILCDPADIVEAALEIDSEFIAFGEQMPTHWQFKTAVLKDPSELVLGTLFHVYPDLWVAYVWNNLRTYRLLLHEEIQKQLATKPESSPDSDALLQRSQHITQQLILDICATIPQYSGCLPTLLGPNSEDIETPKTIFSPDDATSTDIPLTAGAYFILWPLLIAGRISESTLQLDWIMERCLFLGKVTGTNQFFTLIDFLETRK